MRYTEMPVNSTSLPVGGMPMYSPWWVARLLQRATTLSPSAMRSSMVLVTSGKPCRKFAASCLAASACPAALSSSAASRLRYSSRVLLAPYAPRLCLLPPTSSSPPSRSAFPWGPQHTVHGATRRCPFHPSHYALTERPARRRAQVLPPSSGWKRGGTVAATPVRETHDPIPAER